MSKCILPWKQLASIYREDYNTIAEDHHRQCKYIHRLCSFINSKKMFLEFLEFEKELKKEEDNDTYTGIKNKGYSE